MMATIASPDEACLVINFCSRRCRVSCKPVIERLITISGKRRCHPALTVIVGLHGSKRLISKPSVDLNKVTHIVIMIVRVGLDDSVMIVRLFCDSTDSV